MKLDNLQWWGIFWACLAIILIFMIGAGAAMGAHNSREFNMECISQGGNVVQISETSTVQVCKK